MDISRRLIGVSAIYSANNKEVIDVDVRWPDSSLGLVRQIHFDIFETTRVSTVGQVSRFRRASRTSCGEIEEFSGQIVPSSDSRDWRSAADARQYNSVSKVAFFGGCPWAAGRARSVLDKGVRG
jgi:hypothetical protein